MTNPRSLVYALYTHWNLVEELVRLSRELPAFTNDQVFGSIAKVYTRLDADAQSAVLRTLVNLDILQILPRSSDLQLNAYVLEFVRSLTREHELGLSAVLQARVAAIREATAALNTGMLDMDMDRVREAANKLAELFRQITMQLDRDQHALLDLAETAKSADSNMPVDKRYRQVLEAYDHYVEPMNQMMDSGSQGTFYRYLEDAEQALDAAVEQLTVRGALYSHRLQLRQVAYQTKELRSFGRIVAQQSADTLLPLREELRQHNVLTSAISRLLGQVRKRGLRRALSAFTQATALPLWRSQRGFKLYLGDKVRALLATARQYESPTVNFPHAQPDDVAHALEQVDEAGIREHLARSLPVASLLDWLHSHYAQLQDATLLRLFHDLQHEPSWHIEVADQSAKTTLQTIRILHYPHRVSKPL